jgi:hypothetical protein
VADVPRQTVREARHRALPRALALVAAGDAGRRRASIDAVSTRPAEWFFERFAVPHPEEE